MPKVWNKRDSNCPKDAVYVGRRSKWANPYEIGVDGSREEVICMYKSWLAAKLDYKALSLEELRGKDLVYRCAPESCYAVLLLEMANAV